MRMLLTARLDTKIANQAVADGTMGKIVETAMERLKPEAAYFTAVEGDRCCMMIFDMKENSEMPSAAEPFFLAGAKVSVRPVMNADELRSGLTAMKR